MCSCPPVDENLLRGRNERVVSLSHMSDESPGVTSETFRDLAMLFRQDSFLDLGLVEMEARILQSEPHSWG